MIGSKLPKLKTAFYESHFRHCVVSEFNTIIIVILVLSFSDCGKQERERVCSLVSGVCEFITGAELSILKVNLILKKIGNAIFAQKGQQ